MSRSTLPRLHPLTGALLRPVGYRKSGAPIWPILGGSEPGGEPAPGGSDSAPAPGQPGTEPGSVPGEPASGPPSEPQQWDGKVESLPEPVQKMIRDLRTENADRRTKLSTAEQAQQDAIRALAKAAGIELPGEQAPDPAQLTEQLTAAQQAQRQTAVELAVYRTAAKHSGDPDALLDSRSFLTKVADLDPAADDFAAQIDAAIKATVDSNPKLKTGRAPGASGADHTGGSGEGPSKPRTLEEAIAVKMAR